MIIHQLHEKMMSKGIVVLQSPAILLHWPELTDYSVFFNYDLITSED